MAHLNTRATLIAAAASGLLMAGCTSQRIVQQMESINAKVPTHATPENLPNDVGSTGAPKQVEARGQQLKSTTLVHHSSAPWVGSSRTVPRTEDRLPAAFDQIQYFNFGNVPIREVASRLYKLTGIPVRISSDVLISGGMGSTPPAGQSSSLQGSSGPSPTPISGVALPFPIVSSTSPAAAPAPANPMSLDSMEASWSGPLRGFFDILTSRRGLSWEYRDGTVIIYRLQTLVYDVSSFPGKQTYQIANGARSSGTSGSDTTRTSSMAQIDVKETGESNVRESIIKTVQSLVMGDVGASVNWSDGTGRLVVVASKEAQAQVRAYLDKEKKALGTMVNVSFDIYTVSVSDTDEKGINWSSAFESLNQRYGIKFMSPASLTGASAGTLGATYISPNATTNTSAILTALSQYGKSTKLRPFSIMTLNGQWDSKSRLVTTGYLKETTPGTASSSGAAGAPGLKTDTITTGDQFAVLPYVQSDKSVIVKYSITLSDLIGLYDVTTGEGQSLQKVQTPEIDSINASSTVRLEPGQTAVITGLSRLVSSNKENRLAPEAPIAAGGSLKGSVAREHFLVLIRATPM